MNWTLFAILAAAIAVIFFVKSAGQISGKEAASLLKNGALVIDVRSPAEFRGGHLPAAINIPLDEIERVVPRTATDKNQPLLLHCASGMRSGIARGKLRGMGYSRAFNLGSFSRAERILLQAK